MVKRNLLLFQRMIDECGPAPFMSCFTEDLRMIVVPEPDEGKYAQTLICQDCFWRLVGHGIKMPEGVDKLYNHLDPPMTCDLCGKMIDW